jgi:hypothetical protein
MPVVSSLLSTVTLVPLFLLIRNKSSSNCERSRTANSDIAVPESYIRGILPLRSCNPSSTNHQPATILLDFQLLQTQHSTYRT